MKLKDFILEAAIVEARNLILLETVNDYLSLVAAQIKNKKPADLFKDGDPKALDLDHLALIVTGLKIVSNPDYRGAVTKKDIGINPNDAKELFNVLNQVDKMGKDDQAVTNVFKALCKLAPQGLKKERAELDVFKTGSDAERNHELQELQKLVTKVSQMFSKLRASSQTTRGVDVPSLGDI